MGLDMYIKKREFVFIKDNGEITKDNKFYKEDEFGIGNGAIIEMTIAQWRKANQIHEWFVSFIQKGVDDCGRYCITKENLEELLGKCKVILNIINGKEMCSKDKSAKLVVNTTDLNKLIDSINSQRVELLMNNETTEKCKVILPTRSGFFFGKTNYGSSYLYDIVITVQMLERILATGCDYDMIYWASW